MVTLAKPALDVGLVVSDVDASIDFYCGTLGLQRGSSLSIPGNRTLHDVHVGDSLLKLQELHDGAPGPGPLGITAQVGVRYITITVAEIDRVVERLETAGCSFALPLNMTPRGMRMAMLHDPDGNIVELMEAPPT